MMVLFQVVCVSLPTGLVLVPLSPVNDYCNTTAFRLVRYSYFVDIILSRLSTSIAQQLKRLISLNVCFDPEKSVC